MAETSKAKPFSGAERRRHRLYVTRNTEYHVRDGVCVAIRDLTTGNWQLDHSALNRKLSGSVRFTDKGDAYPTLSEPRVGDSLFFASEGPDVVTSRLTTIARPEKRIVSAYPI